MEPASQVLALSFCDKPPVLLLQVILSLTALPAHLVCTL